MFICCQHVVLTMLLVSSLCFLIQLFKSQIVNTKFFAGSESLQINNIDEDYFLKSTYFILKSSEPVDIRIKEGLSIV